MVGRETYIWREGKIERPGCGLTDEVLKTGREEGARLSKKKRERGGGGWACFANVGSS